MDYHFHMHAPTYKELLSLQIDSKNEVGFYSFFSNIYPSTLYHSRSIFHICINAAYFTRVIFHKIYWWKFRRVWDLHLVSKICQQHDASVGIKIYHRMIIHVFLRQIDSRMPMSDAKLQFDQMRIYFCCGYSWTNPK